MFAINQYGSMKFLLLIFLTVGIKSIFCHQFDGSVIPANGDKVETAHVPATKAPVTLSNSSDSDDELTSSDASYSSSGSEEIPDKETFDKKVSELRCAKAKLSKPIFKFSGGNTLLHHAIMHEYDQDAISLTSYAYYLNRDVDPVNNNNETPLHLAIRAKKLNVILINLLVQCGANPFKQNNDYRNSLDLLKKYHSDKESEFIEVANLLGVRVSKTTKRLFVAFNELKGSHKILADAMQIRVTREQMFDQEFTVLAKDVEDLYERQNTMNDTIAGLRHNIHEKNESEKKIKLFMAGISLGLGIKGIYTYQRKIKKKLYASYSKLKEKYEQLAAEAQLFWDTL